MTTGLKWRLRSTTWSSQSGAPRPSSSRPAPPTRATRAWFADRRDGRDGGARWSRRRRDRCAHRDQLVQLAAGNAGHDVSGALCERATSDRVGGKLLVRLDEGDHRDEALSLAATYVDLVERFRVHRVVLGAAPVHHTEVREHRLKVVQQARRSPGRCPTSPCRGRDVGVQAQPFEEGEHHGSGRAQHRIGNALVAGARPAAEVVEELDQALGRQIDRRALAGISRDPRREAEEVLASPRRAARSPPHRCLRCGRCGWCARCGLRRRTRQKNASRSVIASGTVCLLASVRGRRDKVGEGC